MEAAKNLILILIYVDCRYSKES